MKKFKELLVWQKAQELFLELNAIFKNSNGYFFRDQILRVSLSISNNIAEGYEGMTDKEFKYFLFIAKGSAGEVRSMLYLAEKKEKITSIVKQNLIDKSLEISKMLAGFIKKVTN